MSGSTRATPTKAPTIDLYLGGDLGGWALEQVGATPIRAVFTYDDSIVTAARTCSHRIERDPPDPDDVDTGGIAVCVHYPKIFAADLIARYRVMYNLHPGYLPWGRGYYPVFWALWEQTPAGATLHEIEPALDKGSIIMQIEVPHQPHDTGGSLHERVRRAEREIFQRIWPEVRAGKRPPALPPTEGKGTYHSKSEFVRLRDNADIQQFSGAQLVRLIRALTFPGLPGLRVHLGDRLFHLRLEELENEAPRPVQDNR